MPSTLKDDPGGASAFKAFLAHTRNEAALGAPGALLARLRALFGMTSDLAGGAGQETIAQFLGRTGLFGELGRREREWLARIVHVRQFADGEMVYEEGRPGAALFLVRRGSVEILKRTPADAEMSIAILEPPASFEELAAFGSDVVRWTSARAKGDAELLALGRSDLESLSRLAPAVANKVVIRLAEVIASRVRAVIESAGLVS